MAKKKKGYQDYKKYRKNQGRSEKLSEEDIDFCYLAKEYSKLLGKKYHVILNNDEKIDFIFREGNFYHLLGFHKFVRTIFHYMIMQKSIAYSQMNFFRDTLAGNIKYTSYNQQKIQEIEKVPKNQSFELFFEHEKTIAIKNVLYRRFPYFSYDNVIDILKNKIVIDFDQEKSISNVRANKIFYKFLDETQRNLNLFLDDEGEDYFTTSFFLEDSKDIFKKQKNGQYMDMLDVLCLYIEDSKTNEPIDFWINWEVVVKHVTKKYKLSMVKTLKKYFSIGRMTAKNISVEIANVENLLCNLRKGMKEYNSQLIIGDLLEKYVANNKQETALELMEYGIDVMEKISNIELERKRYFNTRKRRKELKRNISKAEKKCDLLKKSYQEIHKLDILKMKAVYIPLLANSDTWEDEFWDYVLNKQNCFNETIYPHTIKEMYLQWGK